MAFEAVPKVIPNTEISQLMPPVLVMANEMGGGIRNFGGDPEPVVEPTVGYSTVG